MITSCFSPFTGRARSAAARVIVIGLLGLTTHHAAAGLITIDFEGTVRTVSSGAFGSFSSGDALSGSFNYNPASLGNFNVSLNSFSIPATGSAKVGEYSFSFTDDLGLEFRKFGSGSTIRLGIYLPTGSPVDGLVPLTFFFNVATGDGGLIPDINHPPLDPLPLVPGSVFVLGFRNPNDLSESKILDGTITDLQVRNEGATTVPEGGTTLPLLGLACAGLVALRGRTSR